MNELFCGCRVSCVKSVKCPQVSESVLVWTEDRKLEKEALRLWRIERGELNQLYLCEILYDVL